MASRSLTDLVGWEAFLHGVFAIAITLLVLDIRVPALEANADGSALVHSLVELWPRYLAYVLGFMYVGTYWLNTNRVLRLLRGVDHWALVIGLIYLMLVAAVPFVTGLLAEYIQQGGGRDQVAAVVFNGWMLLLAAMAAAFVRYVTHRRRLLHPGLDMAALGTWIRLATVAPAIWLIALAAAFFASATVALIVDVAILLLFLREVPIGDGEAAPGK